MKNQFSRHIKQWKVIVAPLLLWSALVTAGYSHGGKKHDESAEKPPVVDTTGQTNEKLALFSVSLDSVYTAIGMSYSAVEPMLKNSCYDCHSAQTEFPWYHSLPIVKQMIDDDIEEARKHLDLDKGFPFGGHATQMAQLEELKKVVTEGEMPLFSYRLMHWGTLIEGEKQEQLFGWIEQSSAAIKEVYSRYQMEIPKESDHDDDGDHDDDHAEGADHDDGDGHDGDHSESGESGHDADHDHDEGGE